MRNKFFSLVIFLMLIFSTMENSFPASFIPMTGEANISKETNNNNFQSISYKKFYQFIQTITIKQSSKQIVGIIVPKKFILPITQQPAGRPDFVSNEPEVITEFFLAKQYGSTGLLAHNHLAGHYFSDLALNDLIVLVTAGREYRIYQIQKILSFQALSPNSPYSNFVDLDDPSRYLNAVELFMEVYANKDTLVIQTCIAKDGEPSWGRLFIQAIPISGIRLETLIDFEEQRISAIF